MVQLRLDQISERILSDAAALPSLYAFRAAATT